MSPSRLRSWAGGRFFYVELKGVVMSEHLMDVKEGDELLLTDDTLVTVTRVTATQLVAKANSHRREYRVRRSDGFLLGSRKRGTRLRATLATDVDHERIAKREALEALYVRQQSFKKELRKYVSWASVKFPQGAELLELARELAKVEFDLRVFREVWAKEIAAAKEQSHE